MKLGKLAALLGAALSAILCSNLNQVHAQAGLSPTELLNAQRMQQQQATQQAATQAQNRKVVTQRLQPPCFTQDSWYPIRTCKVSNRPSVCGKEYNAWPTHEQCCSTLANSGFGQKGCTNIETDFNEKPCYIAGEFWPIGTCIPTSSFARCNENWGVWPTKEACCAPGTGAHEAGCAPFIDGCWVPGIWSPERSCTITNDNDVCLRGWGAFGNEEECCYPGKGFSNGCTVLADGTKVDKDAYKKGGDDGGGKKQEEVEVLDLPDEMKPTPVVQASSSDKGNWVYSYNK
jgi:hypothetical protein